MSLFTLIKFIELITAVAGSLHFRKYAGTFLRYFLYLLWIVTIVEFTMAILKSYYDLKFQNNFIYNILSSLQYVYFFLLYHQTIQSPKYRRWVMAFMTVFVVSVILNFMFVQKLTVTAPFHSYTFTAGAILLIVTIGLFLFEILNTEKVLYFQRYLMFWISIGLFVFYTGIIPFVISLNLLPALLSNDSLVIIFFALNLVMYSCFTIGFFISHKYTEA